jgi:hypothetical protein
MIEGLQQMKHRAALEEYTRARSASSKGMRQITWLRCSVAFDTNTAAGRMVFSMVSAMAEFERNVISGSIISGP